MTIIQTMPITTTLADAKARLSELVTAAHEQHERVVITRNGRPVAALISLEDLESLEETIEVMSDPELMAAIEEGNEQIARGEVYSLDDVTAELRKRGRT